MRYLFPQSTRPTLLVDPASSRTRDPGSSTLVGYPAPMGRERLVRALPTGDPDGPALLEAAAILVDQDGNSIGGPQGELLGQPAIVIHRLLSAGSSPETRR